MKSSRKRSATPQPRPKPAPRKAAEKPVSAARSSAFSPNVLAYALLAAALLVVVIVRVRLLNVPLERDEGEYALMGQLILQGIPPYETAYNMKLPGTYYAYALLMVVFGQTAAGIRLGLLVVHLISIGLLFAIGRRIGGVLTGAVAAATYGLLCLVPDVLGLMAHATHFNVLFALAGWLLLLNYLERPGWVSLVNSGLCFGLAFIAKQQGVFFPIFGALALAWAVWGRAPRMGWAAGFSRLLVFGVAVLLPYLLVLLSAVINGTFERLWHWTVEYASQYAGTKDAERIWNNLTINLTNITKGVLPLWLLGLLGGLSALWLSPVLRPWRVQVLLFTGLSLLCVVPGFYFRSHYFIAFFPALALLTGLAVQGWGEWLSGRMGQWAGLLPTGLFLALAIYGVRQHRNVFFQESPEFVCYRLFGRSNPFVEAVEVGKFLRARAKPGDRLAVVGSEPQLYFYSKLLPATGYIYTYPLMENQRYSEAMQREMAAEIERAKPRFLVYVNSPLSWFRQSGSSDYIFDWYSRYSLQYHPIQVVEMPPKERARYWQGDALREYVPRESNHILVYERSRSN